MWYSSTKDIQDCCSKRKQAVLKWLKYSGEINGDMFNIARREAGGNFRNNGERHLKGKINEFVTQ
jgi:hypothetical protein